MSKQRTQTMYTTFVEIKIHILRLDCHMNRFSAIRTTETAR